MLELVDTAQRLVRFTPLGQRFVRSGMEKPKRTWKEQHPKLALFRLVREMVELHDAPGGSRDPCVGRSVRRLSE